ncbi:MAG: HAD-superfamily hydrolase, subfamily [Rhodospirillales bacterium]|nr:HAD-superfamily hydrolase, subfamily [Rhodospirillales bacterium]
MLFDWDNTLVENWRTIRAALNAALADAGLPPMEMEQVMFQARHSAQDIFPKLFGDGWRHARTIFYDHFAQKHLAGLSIMPGAEELLDVLRERGVILAVVSNKKGDLLRREIDFLGWTARFAGIVGAQDASADKPDPAPVHLALDAAGLLASGDIWLVGDTDIDMRTAVAAGCYPVLVGLGPSDPALLEGAQPALRCHNCDDLAGFVRRHWRTISV